MSENEAGIRSALRRLTRSNRSFYEGEERTRSAELGGTPCGGLQDRRRVQVAGSLRSVSLRPRAGVPALEAELADGTGAVTLIFLGRREIPGITPGRWLRVNGLVSCDDGRKTIYNPGYELIPAPRG
ncbi:MAG: OB-fold nucleic acid binding domain-containing protein [Actinomycetales bacterium]